MPTRATPTGKPRFCSDCGARLNEGARFCHECGSSVQGRVGSTPTAPGVSNALRWGVPGAAVLALVVLSVLQFDGRGNAAASADATPQAAMPLGAGAVRAPDISSMSPVERADRLFNRVMLLSTEGKTDSVAFFGPMAISAFEALAPLGTHHRYDLGLVALVSGNVAIATAQADTMLAQRPTHLLGLSLAARAADARGDAAAAKSFRSKLLAAEQAERAQALPEYVDHDADIRTAVAAARAP